jgi:hypothetical protein
MEDPAHPNYPQNLLNVVGPRNMVHSWATDKDDPTEMPRWGKIGMQHRGPSQRWGSTPKPSCWEVETRM